MSTLIYADFIAGFPEFSDTTKYTMGSFNFWATQADLNINQRRAHRVLTLAQCLFVAHNMALAAKAELEAEIGKTVGEVTGALASKAIDKVSASYAQTSTIEGAGPYNLTTYGQRFYQLMQGLNTAVYAPGPGSTRGRYGYGVAGYGGRGYLR